MSPAIRTSLILSVLSLIVATTALMFALRGSPSQRTPPPTQPQAEVMADRARSGTQLRQMALALHSYANDHDWNPPLHGQWRELLIESEALTEDMFEVRGGQEVKTPYHYIQPTRDEVLLAIGQPAPATTRPAGEVVVFYEDPGLWKGGGGNVVFLDSSMRWFDAAEHAELLDGLGHP